MNVKIANAAYDRSLARVHEATALTIVLIALAVIGSIGLGAIIARIIARQIGGEPDYASHVVHRVADGDTSVEVRVREGDTTSLLAAMSEMVARLNYASDVTRQIANGDMTVQIDLREGDRNSLLGAMDEMVNKLAQIVTNVRGAASELAAASEELTSSAELLSQNASEQAASVEETSA